MKSGTLRHRMRIESLDPITDSSGEALQDPFTGEVVSEWRTVATVWAAIEPLSARDFVQSSSKQSEITARLVIRYRDDLRPEMRFVHTRTGRADVIYKPHGFLADKDSGLEYLTIPVSSGIGEGE